jgi:XapX domain-containing protein
MRIYVLAVAVGLLVGVIYSLLNVRSPAPPLVALVGLFGMLVGEQIIPVAKELVAGQSLAVAWQQAKCTAHMFGVLPGRHTDTAAASFKPSLEKHS